MYGVHGKSLCLVLNCAVNLMALKNKVDLKEEMSVGR